MRLGRVPDHQLLGRSLDTAGRKPMQDAVGQLTTSRLRLLSSYHRPWQFERSASVPELRAGEPAPADLLTADDVDLLLPGPLAQTLHLLRLGCLSEPMALSVTAPEGLALEGGRLRPEPRRRVDVALRLSHDDQFDPGITRAGEGDCEVLAHRRGPVGTIKVASRGHCRRFVGLPALSGRGTRHRVGGSTHSRLVHDAEPQQARAGHPVTEMRH